MKKKIRRYLILTVSLALTAALFSAALVFYHMYQEQILEGMRIHAETIKEMVHSGEEFARYYKNSQEDVRITVIGKNGSVLYDSQADSTKMQNHSDRSEVKEAEEKGAGYAIRNSDTRNLAMYYYAVRLDNGDILRISKAEDNIWSVFCRTMSVIAGIGVLMVLICIILSKYLTEGIVKPIERVAADIDCAENVDTYEELVPFVNTIRDQHKAIMKNANMRQEFTANVSHELKTPLTSISGYAELIESGMADEKNTWRFAGEIRQNANRLLNLINDIIRLSELDGGHAEVEFEWLDLYELAEKCAQMLEVNARNHKVEICCQGTCSSVYANREMMEELIYNLCDNAIRYNQPGGRVEVAVKAEKNETVLTVSDTGIGIPKDSQERIFERFYRVDKSRSKSTGGTGLGLAIVKHIVVQHQAKLELKSEVGKGTVMRVVFENLR